MTKEQIEQKAMQIANDGIKIIEKFDPKNPPNFYEGAYHGAIEMSRWLLENLWISVEDELPPFEEVVIAHYDSSNSRYGAIFEHAEMFTHRTEDTYAVKDKYNFCIYCDEIITHWMPIPKLKM